MPTYEYKCLNCGKVFEVFQSMSEEPLKSCQVCGGQLERLVSAGAGLIFRGSGFYITDYKKRDRGAKEKPAETKTDVKKESQTASEAKEKKTEDKERDVSRETND